MSTTATVLAAATDTGTGEAVTFWVLAPIAVAASLGMVLSRKAVHSALLLASVMICLAIFYLAQDAPFLGVVQVVVYTGAVMMLFLFVLMLVGVDSGDSLKLGIGAGIVVRNRSRLDGGEPHADHGEISPRLLRQEGHLHAVRHERTARHQGARAHDRPVQHHGEPGVAGRHHQAAPPGDAGQVEGREPGQHDDGRRYDRCGANELLIALRQLGKLGDGAVRKLRFCRLPMHPTGQARMAISARRISWAVSGCLATTLTSPSAAKEAGAIHRHAAQSMHVEST